MCLFWRSYSPAASSDTNIHVLHSVDGGQCFEPASCQFQPPHPSTIVYEEQIATQIVDAPAGAMDHEGALWLVWWETSDQYSHYCPGLNCPPTPFDPVDRIQITRGTLDVSDHLAFNDGVRNWPEAGHFRGLTSHIGGYVGAGLFASGSVAVAVDTSGGPFHGKAYIAFIKVVDPTFPISSYSMPRATRVMVMRCSAAPGQPGGVSVDFVTEVSPYNDQAAPPEPLAALQLLPWVAVDQRGNVGVSWYDTRFDPAFPRADPRTKYDVMFAYSTDGGATYTTARVTRPHTDGLPLSETPGQHVVNDYSHLWPPEAAARWATNLRRLLAERPDHPDAAYYQNLLTCLEEWVQ